MLIKAARKTRKFAQPDSEFEQWPAPGFAEILNQVEKRAADGTHKYRILDLGPARQSVLELSALRPFDLQIADLVSNTTTIDADPGSIYSDCVFSEEYWERCLPSTDDRQVDAILCWDIFNYLGIEDITNLARCLSRRCVAGAYLHSIIYTSETMPPNPLQFDLLLPSSLCRNNNKSAASVPSPRFGMALTQHSLPQFEVAQFFQLDSDVQEEIYRRSIK